MAKKLKPMTGSQTKLPKPATRKGPNPGKMKAAMGKTKRCP